MEVDVSLEIILLCIIAFEQTDYVGFALLEPTSVCLNDQRLELPNELGPVHFSFSGDQSDLWCSLRNKNNKH